MTSTNTIEEVKRDFETEIFRNYKEPGKYYAVFTTTGESMNSGKLGDLRAGWDLLGEFINPDQYENELKLNKFGYVIMTLEGSYHKDIVNYDQVSKTALLRSRNPEADLREFYLQLDEDAVVYKVTHTCT